MKKNINKIFLKTLAANLILLIQVGCFDGKFLGGKAKEFKPIQAKSEPLKAIRFNLEINNYCVPTTAKRVSFNVINRNYHLTSAGVLADSDGDGVTDKDENSNVAQLFGISPTRYDTNGDRYSDAIVYYGLITLTQQGTFPVCGMADLDFDGLPDCAENVIGTDPLNFDTDKDGLPDELELFVGLNPLNKDSHLDSDMDGVSNFQEVVIATPINEQNKLANIESLKISYDLKTKGSSNGQECFDYLVKNILYETARDKNNWLEIYFIEEIAGKTVMKRYDRLVLWDELKAITVTKDELPTFKVDYIDLKAKD